MNMKGNAYLLSLIILLVPLAGCTGVEEACNRVVEFDNDFGDSDDKVLKILMYADEGSQFVPPPYKAGMWVVGKTAKLTKDSMEFCMAVVCLDSGNDTSDACEQTGITLGGHAEGYAKSLLPPDVQTGLTYAEMGVKIAFAVMDYADSNSVPDEAEDISDFNLTSYTIVDDFSSSSWEFSVDSEGNIYHFF
tara:strand:+ start:120 stop:692 length:573 start_codon:yes stop_codon:yes gene_type:complete